MRFLGVSGPGGLGDPPSKGDFEPFGPYGYFWSLAEYRTKWGDVLELICLGAWAIWNDRNNQVHSRPIPKPEDRCDWIMDYLAEYKKANPVGGPHTQTLAGVRRMIEEGKEFIIF